MNASATAALEKLSKPELITEVSVLKNKLKQAEEEADSSRTEINVLNRNLVVMHERERRMEEMILELSFELGGKGNAPPKPKEYAVSPVEAIDKYVQIATSTLQKDKRVWEYRCQQLEEKLQEYEEREKERENEKPPLPPLPPPPTPDAASPTGDTAALKKKCKKLEKEVEKLKTELNERPHANGTSNENEGKSNGNDNEELMHQLTALEQRLGEEKQKCKEKIKKNVELKEKLAKTVQKATDRDNRRKARIKELEELLTQHNITTTPQLQEDDAGSPRLANSARSEPDSPLASPSTQTPRSSRDFPAAPPAVTTTTSPPQGNGPSNPTSPPTPDTLSPPAAQPTQGRSPRMKIGGPPMQPPAPGEKIMYKGTEVTCRFAGNTHFQEGYWLGFEFPTPQGKNNGTVQGQAYFTCPPNCGIFVPWPACSSNLRVILKH
eukprot:TRINITY_DN27053_c0_g1_i1.p1 TRINITY_DN27053_c0_g1~~TRINITY_DN27053_c0_g1_i1.p1  ORF type:complete len:437 (+),score=75.75 TRINITY_DN27053_c0_g1_i1:17-1327(+)